MQRKLPRVLESQIKRALAGQATLARAIVRDAPDAENVGGLVLSPDQLIYVDERGTRTWPTDQIAVAEHPVPKPGQPVSFSVLAGEEILRYLMPRGVPIEHVGQLLAAIGRLESADAAARVAAMPWWEAKALWPFAVKGRVAGGTTALELGQFGSVGLGRRGVSFYPGEQTAPSLQLAWQEITGVFVEDREELTARVTSPRAHELGIFQWGIDTSEGDCYVTVVTKQHELYVASSAPAAKLRSHWESVLERFENGPFEEAFEHPVSEASPSADVVSRLERLTALYESGVLNEAEFTAAKAAILRGELPG